LALLDNRLAKSLPLLTRYFEPDILSSMRANIEKLLIYPVTIILTVLAMQAWTSQPAALSAVLTAVAISLWALPFFGVRFILPRRILIWVSTALLLLGLAWIYMWSWY
jgi:hypothetical protein